MSESETGRDTILAVGAACGEPVRKALLELLEIFEGQVKRAYAHELAEKQRDYAEEQWAGDKPALIVRRIIVGRVADLIDPEVLNSE